MSSPIEVLTQRLARHTPVEIALPANEQAAIAVILVPASDLGGLELLLIQRAIREGDPWSGHMALPGGLRDMGDADLNATAVREAREETGIDLAQARFLGRLDDLRPIRQSQRSLSVRPFVYCADSRPDLTSSAEVADALWVPLGRLRSCAGEACVVHRGAPLNVPAYLVDGRTVWGMTQRVLSALLDLSDSDR